MAFWRGKSPSQDPCHRTTKMLDLTRHAVEEITGDILPDYKLWISLQNKTLPRNIKGFLWCTMHSSHKIGHYWQKMSKPEFTERAICEHCSAIENMDHILTSCELSGQGIVWELAEAAWSLTHKDWVFPSIGVILSCGLNIYVNNKGRPDKGLNCLCTIIISESAHLIWKIRCEWQVGRGGSYEKLHHQKEIKNMWFLAMYQRLLLDKWSSDTKYGGKALRKSTLVNTWKHLIPSEDIWTSDKQSFTRVLVGKGLGRPKECNR